MTTFANYRRYKKLRLRGAWNMAGMNYVVFPFLRGVVIGLIIIGAYTIVSNKVQADQKTADNRVAAELAQQAVLLKAMGDVISKCTSPGENFITVDGEIWACGAAPTGIKVRP